MAERTKRESTGAAQGPAPTSVDALASRALSVVAERNAQLNMTFKPELAQKLHDAAAEVESNKVPDVIDEMRARGVSAEAISDAYIPFVARQMGDEWCEDSLSFARVTIGTARLQSALRSLGAEWTALGLDVDEKTQNAAAVIVIVVRDSFHTLGAVVLAGQLRRLGVSVRLSMGPSPAELRAIMASTAFDAVLISANESEGLDSLRETVDIIKTSALKVPPIIVGGGMLDQDVDVKALSGADFVTKDPYEALEHCGLLRTRAKSEQTTPQGT